MLSNPGEKMCRSVEKKKLEYFLQIPQLSWEKSALNNEINYSQTLKAFPKRAPFIKKAKESNENEVDEREREKENWKKLLMIFHRNDFAMNDDSVAHHFSFSSLFKKSSVASHAIYIFTWNWIEILLWRFSRLLSLLLLLLQCRGVNRCLEKLNTISLFFKLIRYQFNNIND